MPPKWMLRVNVEHVSKINTLLQDLNLPIEKHSLFTKEETLFLRYYDIKRFGHSECLMIHKLWMEKEHERNRDEAEILWKKEMSLYKK